MELVSKYNVDDEIHYLNMQGKLTKGQIESILVNVGTSVTRVSHWVETARSPVKVNISYRLYSHPQGFSLAEDMIFEYKKEEVNAE